MSKKREHHKLFMVGSDAPFQFTEAYKSLRTNLEFLAATSDCKTILITSSVPGEGKSNVAVNLAITLADSGKRVVLVDCDMRKSTISRYLHIPRDHIGITNTITGKDRTQLANALVNFKDLGIVVLPVGTIPPNPSELLATKAMESTFAARSRCMTTLLWIRRRFLLLPMLQYCASMRMGHCWLYARVLPPLKVPS